MATKKEAPGPTPNGGVKSEIYYLDRQTREAVDESVATAAEIVELDAKGNIIHRTYGEINRANRPA